MLSHHSYLPLARWWQLVPARQRVPSLNLGSGPHAVMNLLYQYSCPFLHLLQVVPMLQRCPSLQVRDKEPAVPLFSKRTPLS